MRPKTAAEVPEAGPDPWMIARGFRETTPEEHDKFAKFFKKKETFPDYIIRILKRLGF